jgi:signal peptidase I
VRRPLRARVVGSSMTPTFADGQRVWAFRRRRYAVGDVIVFTVPADARGGGPEWRIKRVCAVAGDPAPDWMPGPERTVPPGTVAVSGDNPVSQDSRQLGWIPTTGVLGRVRTRWRMRRPTGYRRQPVRDDFQRPHS